MLKIYVASSWKNPYQPSVVDALRSKKHEVYDFRNPRPGNSGFHWSEIDPLWRVWTPQKYREALNHPLAEAGFKSDFDAMQWADLFVGVAPFGRSTSLEMGWAAGAGKPTILYLPEMLGEAELMVKMCDHICTTPEELLATLKGLRLQDVRKSERKPFWHSPEELPEEERRVYIKMKNSAQVLGWFNCKYLGNFEMSSMDYELDITIAVEDIEKWAYVEELEAL